MPADLPTDNLKTFHNGFSNLFRTDQISLGNKACYSKIKARGKVSNQLLRYYDRRKYLVQ